MLVSKIKANKKNLSQSASTLGKQRGFTLLEVMVASFVMAVGMLGSTAMMLRGLQEADNTNYEAIIAQSAMNMAERMRGNIRGLVPPISAYDNLDASTNAVDCTSAVCDAATVASYHAYLWGAELNDLLPNLNATANVTALSASSEDSIYRITINWDANVRTGTTTGSNQTKTYVMIFQP